MEVASGALAERILEAREHVECDEEHGDRVSQLRELCLVQQLSLPAVLDKLLVNVYCAYGHVNELRKKHQGREVYVDTSRFECFDAPQLHGIFARVLLR